MVLPSSKPTKAPAMMDHMTASLRSPDSAPEPVMQNIFVGRIIRAGVQTALSAGVGLPAAIQADFGLPPKKG
jgi:hypothetical protein